MNAADDIAAIRVRLPYFDRRALSEAWFSALHLASDGPVAATAHAASLVQAISGSARPKGSREASLAPLTRRPVQPRPAGTASSSIRASLRDANGGSASRLAKPAAALPPRVRAHSPMHAAFTLSLEGARVQVVMRREGATVHVVALCARRHVELVRRALACAAFALRSQGEAIRSSIRATEGSR